MNCKSIEQSYRIRIQGLFIVIHRPELINAGVIITHTETYRSTENKLMVPQWLQGCMVGIHAAIGCRAEVSVRSLDTSVMARSRIRLLCFWMVLTCLIAQHLEIEKTPWLIISRIQLRILWILNHHLDTQTRDDLSLRTVASTKRSDGSIVYVYVLNDLIERKRHRRSQQKLMRSRIS